MTSTRIKNCKGNYQAEQYSIKEQARYNVNDVYGAPPLTCYPGNGLLPAKTPALQLCNNYCDIESQLFGIGSTNLVTPKPHIYLNAKPIVSLSIIKQIPLIVPERLTILPDQRHLYLS